MTRQNMVALVIGCAYFMQNLDASILTTALPQIAASMGTDPVRLNIVITGYLVSLAVFIPASGWLADRFGARAVFMTAIVVFILTSAFCGFSNSVLHLTVARIIQGMTVAVVVPVGRLVLLRSVKKSEIVKATVFLTVPAQTAAVIGPAVGGFITTYASWRWIFLINVPIGLIGLFFAARLIDNFRDARRRPFDWFGFILTAASLSMMLYALEVMGRGGSALWEVLSLLGGGLVVGAVAVRHALRTAHPLMDLSILRLPTFSSNVWGGSLFRIGWGGLPFLLPLLFQVVFGMNAFASGLLMLANAVGSVSSRVAGPTVIARLGFRRLLVRNGIIGALTMLACGFFTATTPQYVILLVLFIGGFFQSLQVTALNAIAYADVKESEMSSATAIGNLTQQLGKAFGVALSALFLNLSLNWHGGSQLSGADFLFAYAGLAVLSAASLPFFFMLRPDAGAEVSGHQPGIKKGQKEGQMDNE